MDSLPLLPGKYFISLKLGIDEMRPDVLSGVVTFEVEDGGQHGFLKLASDSWGKIVVPHVWQISSRMMDNVK
jgi:hypothetical protein